MDTIRHALRFALLSLLIAGAHDLAFARANAKSAPPEAPTLDQCSWDRPGVDPFMGDVVGAVDRYVDIAPDVRQRIKARMTRRAYDDVVVIRQSSITGKAKYGSAIRDMHFGANRLCRSVSRAGWSKTMQERGLVYCDSGQCVLVPTVCRNVSRITRAGVEAEHIVVAPPPIASMAETAAPPPLLSSPAIAAKPLGEGEDQPGAASFASASSGGNGSGFASVGAGGDHSQGGGVGASNTSGGAPGPLAAPESPLAVAPVPEPETWALLLAGLAATGFCAKRRAAP